MQTARQPTVFWARERRMLQCAIAVLGFVPVIAGLAGSINGLPAFSEISFADRDFGSHARYLSGLLLGIGLSYWSLISRIEHNGAKVRLLTSIVVAGGSARLFGVYREGWPSVGMTAALGLELLVAPALAIWVYRLENALVAHNSLQVMPINHDDAGIASDARHRDL